MTLAWFVVGWKAFSGGWPLSQVTTCHTSWWPTICSRWMTTSDFKKLRIAIPSSSKWCGTPYAIAILSSISSMLTGCSSQDLNTWKLFGLVMHSVSSSCILSASSWTQQTWKCRTDSTIKLEPQVWISFSPNMFQTLGWILAFGFGGQKWGQEIVSPSAKASYAYGNHPSNGTIRGGNFKPPGHLYVDRWRLYRPGI